MDSIGQGQADLPLLVICDLLTGHMAICDKPDVSETIVFKFVSDYRDGKINVVPLPMNCLETVINPQIINWIFRINALPVLNCRLLSKLLTINKSQLNPKHNSFF